ncbi:hypothetical protein ACFWWB_35740 [Streptomyces sp. NPDC058690]|uniref:hypothetical protein n=1 Tax=Streptomyces sp. NPDC058690 TaxID=3346600 RepID=UPI003654D378
MALDAGQMLATANIAQAGQRNWAINLHNTLADEGIYPAINLMIGTEAPEGVPFCAPDEIALDYWNVHTSRTQAEHCISAWDSGQHGLVSQRGNIPNSNRTQVRDLGPAYDDV